MNETTKDAGAAGDIGRGRRAELAGLARRQPAAATEWLLEAGRILREGPPDSSEEAALRTLAEAGRRAVEAIEGLPEETKGRAP